MRQDPRIALDAEARRHGAISRPAVADRNGASDGLVIAAGVLGVCLLGALTMNRLSAGRSETAPPPPAASIAVREPVPAPAEPVAPSVAPAIPAPPRPAGLPEERARAPALILDTLSASDPSAAAPADAAKTVAAAEPQSALNGDEQFAARMGPSGDDTARAVALSDPGSIIIQGTLITAVLETAVDTSLPGYARAVVSRDVRSFDGSRVLVPQGSRLIGRYRSGVSMGQTRAFIIWTRLVRPDGLWVELASPTTDESGRTGLEGDVDTHFFDRFGSAIILSIVGSAASVVSSTADVVISSTSDAQSAAAAAMQASGNIPPTIAIPQGEPIRVFVARDLDFSGAP